MLADTGYEAAIGRWFATRLVPAMGEVDLPAMFRGLRDDHPVSAATDPSVAAGGPVAAALAPFGVTPVTFAVAARALSGLARAALAGSPAGTPLALQVAAVGVPEGTVEVPPGKARLHVAAALGTEDGPAYLVADILVLAAANCPGTIGGFRATRIPGGVSLVEDLAVVAWTDPVPSDDRAPGSGESVPVPARPRARMPAGLTVAVSGGIGAGKRELAERLAERLGGRCVGFGDEVRRAGMARGLDFQDEEALQSLEQDMVVRDSQGLVDAVLAHRPADGSPLVVHGLRHVETLIDLRRRCGGPLHLVHVDVSEADRARTVTGRSGMTPRDLARLSNHLCEAQVDRILPQYADARVEGRLPLQLRADWILWRLGLDRFLARAAAA